MIFKREFLEDALGLPCTALENKVISASRWNITRAIVFEHGGKYYQTKYSIGATENPWVSPWGDDKYVEAIEVDKMPVTVEKWMPVDTADTWRQRGW